MSESTTKANRGVLKRGLIVTACAFGFGFALVPLYRIACEHVLGIKLEAGPADAGKLAKMTPDLTRWVTVQFVTGVNSHLAWNFSAEKTSLSVHPGEMAEAWFDAGNSTDHAIVGNAVPSEA